MSLETLKNRLRYDDTLRYSQGESKGLDSNYTRLEQMGGTDQWTRMREDKLRSLMKVLFFSYQRAIIKFDNDDREFEFRCLINHDKLKVDYEDKILSIPFREKPVNKDIVVDTGTPEQDDNNKYRIKTGDTFLWLSGNEDYMPDTHWMIYLQYSEETAYFRGEIRLCEDIVEINGKKYYAWSSGPNEQEIVWNVKKGVIWNDLNYTKLLFITKTQETINYLQRFDRIKMANGKFDDDGNALYDWWEVKGVNTNYGDGIIRIAIGETYNNTPGEEGKAERDEKQAEQERAAAASEIKGDIYLYPYETKVFTVEDPIPGAAWSISNDKVAKIVKQDENSLTLEVTTGKSFKQGFDVIYNGTETLHVIIKSL